MSGEITVTLAEVTPPNGGLVSTIREPRNFRSQGSKDSMIWCDVFVHVTLPASSVSRTELLVLFEGIFVFARLAIRSVFFSNFCRAPKSNITTLEKLPSQKEDNPPFCFLLKYVKIYVKLSECHLNLGL